MIKISFEGNIEDLIEELEELGTEEVTISKMDLPTCECKNCKECCENDEVTDEELQEIEDDFTPRDLCKYVLSKRLDECKTIEEKLDVLEELYDTAHEDGYKLAFQDDIETKMDFLDEIDD